MADLADVNITVNVDNSDVVKAYKSFESMKRQLGTLELALRKGEISQKAYNRAVNQLSKELGEVTGDFRAAQSSVMKWSYALKQATAEQIKFQTVSGKGMKQFQLAVQQTGYQVGDFFTQVAMGQNPIMAFSTQMTQLAGFFRGPWGAAIGAGISILGALAVAYSSTRKEAETFEDALEATKELSDNLSDAYDAVTTSLDDLSLKYGEAAIRVREFALAQADYQLAQAQKRFEDQTVVTKEMLGIYANGVSVMDAFGESLDFSEALRNIEEDFNVGSKAAQQLLSAMRDYQGQDTFAGQQESLQRLNALLIELGIPLSQVPDDIAYAINEMMSLSNETDRAKAAADALAAAMGKVGIELANGRSLMGLTGDQLIAGFYDPESNKPSRGGGGKTPAQQLEEYLVKLERDAALKRAQVGLSEEAARTLEIENEYKIRGIEIDSARIEAIVNLESETRKLIEAEKAAEKQQKFYTDTLMSGMESLITGSKSVNEAFRDMLRNMLLDIYRQKVMQPIADAGSNFLMNLFMAKGGAFNKGVQMFADGGVVNAPTAFGHSGGVGVMGEAGPEAIMPLKRGPDGKLGVAGSAGNVVVNQSFNFSANGDDSVKRIIAQAAPQIAQMTQKQIMDSRRRGGQMKATFS